MKRKPILLLGLSGQWAAGVACIAGIVVELVKHAHLGYVLVTAGAFTFAVFTKVRYWLGKNDFLNF